MAGRRAKAAAGAQASWSIEDVYVTVEGGETRSIAEWQGDDTDAEPVSVQNADGSTKFEFDDPTGRPGDVVVYTNGR